LTFQEIEIKHRFQKSEQDYKDLLKGFGNDRQCKELGSDYVAFLKDPLFRNNIKKLKTLRQKYGQVS
jgi:hypothetical protein